MTAQRNLCLGLVLLCLLGLSGCAAVVAGGAAAGATYVYSDGWLSRDYDASIKTSHTASLAALRELGVSVQKSNLDIASGKIDGKTKDSEVWVELESKAANVTKISVRVGYLGDREAAERIHKALQARLGQS